MCVPLLSRTAAISARMRSASPSGSSVSSITILSCEGGNGKAPPPPSQLKIVIDETDDPDGDAERMRALIAAVRENSGTQTARLSVRQRDGEEVDLELPAVSPSPELTRRLSDIIGPWGAVYE